MNTIFLIFFSGRYKPPGDASLDKPLSLQLLADTQEALDIAVNRINEIIRREQVHSLLYPFFYKVTKAVANLPPPSGQIAEYLFSEKVLVNMENCDPTYGVTAKILGPNVHSLLSHF